MTALTAAWRRLPHLLRRRGLLEVVVIGVAYSLYFAVRSAVVGGPEIAYANAVDITDLQRRLGLFWEDDMNAWVSQRLFWAQAANLVYVSSNDRFRALALPLAA